MLKDGLSFAKYFATLLVALTVTGASAGMVSQVRTTDSRVPSGQAVALGSVSFSGSTLGKSVPPASSIDASGQTRGRVLSSNDNLSCGSEGYFLEGMKDSKKIASYQVELPSLISSGIIVTHLGSAGAKFDFSAASYGLITKGGATFDVVSIPIQSNGFNRLSNLTAIFGADGLLSTYSEVHYRANNSGNLEIVNFTNGALAVVNDTQARYLDGAALDVQIERVNRAIQDELNRQDQHVAASGESPVIALDWHQKVLCLAAILGVNEFVAGFVAGACVGTCGGALVPVCAACIGGVIAFAGVDIGAIVGCFKL